MALTKVSGGILDPGINVAGIITATGFDGPFVGGSSDNINAGIITATKFVGPFDSVIIGGGTTITSSGINVTGIVTATGLDVNGNGDISGNLVVGGNLTANGDFTTLNTTLREVELLNVDANSSAAAGIITQRGSGNILDLYDTGTAIFSVRDGGNIIMGTGAGSVAPHAPLHIRTGTTGAITTLLKLHGPFTSNTGSEGTAIDFGTASDTSTGARIIGSREAAGAKGALRFCTGRENDAGFNDGHMVIDETGNVGIASAIPSAKLDVNGTSQFADTATFNKVDDSISMADSLIHTGNNGTKLQFHVNTVELHTSGSQRLLINSAGNLIFKSPNNNTGEQPASLQWWNENSAGIMGKISLVREAVSQAPAALAFYTSPNVDSSANSGQGDITERLRITSDGNIGFNRDSVNAGDSETETATSTPKRIVFNNDYSNVETDAALKIYLFNNNATRQGFTSGANFNVQYHSSGNSASKHTFYTQNTERVRIDSHITAAAGVNLNLDSTLGSGANTAYSGFDGRLVFDTSYSDTARGPNKIQLQNASNTWIGGFGISSNTLDIYTGGVTAFRRSTGTNTYTTQMSVDHLGNLSPSGDVRLTSSTGHNSSTAVTDAAWSRLEFDDDYSDTARGPNKIVLTPFNNWKGGFGISSNSLDVYTGGIIHFYGKTNTDDASNKETLAKFITDGAVELYHNNLKKLETTSSGVDITGDLVLPSSGKSLKIWTGGTQGIVLNHGGTFGELDSQTGMMRIKAGTVNLANRFGNYNFINCAAGGSVDLYYDAQNHTTPKLATSATGVTVDGEVTASQDFPITKPVLDFNFAAEKKLDPRFTFYRRGTASYVDKKGIIRYASSNEPRFDHHPTTGASLGLLIEKMQSNYQPYSVDMDAGADYKNAVTVVNDAAISPDGTKNASKIIGSDNQSTSQRLGWSTQTVNNSSYTMWSIWLKSEETSCIIQIYSNTYTFGADHLNVELADGTVGGHTNNDATFRYNLEKYPNKWWRLSWGGNGQGGAGGMYVAVVPAMNSARGANTGSAHGKVWYAWGVQEEVSTESRIATSYIPTYGAAATRYGEHVQMQDDDFDDFFDRFQGTIINEHSNALQSYTGGGSAWEFNNDQFQTNIVTQTGSGYSHSGYPGAHASIFGDRGSNGSGSGSGSDYIQAFGPNFADGLNQSTSTGNGRFPHNNIADYTRYYKTWIDGMSYDLTPSTNILRTASGGESPSDTTNTENISLHNISKLEIGGGATDKAYADFYGRIKRWVYYDKVVTRNQLANLTAQLPQSYL